MEDLTLSTPDELESTITEPMNDCLKDDFQSKIDPYFKQDAPVAVREYQEWRKKHEE